jgi:hypothetical protein
MYRHRLEWLVCHLTVLAEYAAEATTFLNKIVKGGDSWVHYYIPE